MLYNYDNALADDLRRSFNPNNVINPTVKVVDADGIVDLIAQIQEDEVKFPVVLLTRHPDTPIDTNRRNFTWMKRGVASVIDLDTNNLYYEKVIPIELGYDITVLATNTADMDELVKELMFKYVSQYFITFTLPYECKRKVRFGVNINEESDIEHKSGTFDYIEGGKLYQTIIPLKIDGAVLVSYTPAKLKRSQFDLAITNPPGHTTEP